MIKAKIFRIILIISLVPYVILLVGGVWAAIFGFSFLFETSYGITGFIASIFLNGIRLYPLILICLPYQIIFAIYMLIKERRFK